MNDEPNDNDKDDIGLGNTGDTSWDDEPDYSDDD